MFQEQTITCKDCSKSFVFTAEQARTFEEKGYKNLPIRCEECRKNKASAMRRRRRFPRKPYRKPLPPPTGINADGRTKYNAGKVAFVNKQFGFVDYNGGQIYFERTAFDGDQSKLLRGLYVDFTVGKDENDRFFAKTVSPATSVPPEVLAADKAKAEATHAEDGEGKRSAPRRRGPPRASTGEGAAAAAPSRRRCPTRRESGY